MIIWEAIHRVTRNEGDFAGAFRQNLIRVIGSYGREQQPDECTGRIKAKQEEMVALIAENAKIKVISADRIQIQFQSGIVMEQEIGNE